MNKENDLKELRFLRAIDFQVCLLERAQTMLLRYPGDADFLRFLGSALGSLNRFHDAFDAMQMANRTATTEQKYKVLADLAYLYFEKGEYADAGGSYEKAFEIREPFSMDHINYSECLVKQGRYREVIEILCEANYDEGQAMFTLGVAYRATEDYENALHWFQRAKLKYSDAFDRGEAELAVFDLQKRSAAEKTMQTNRESDLKYLRDLRLNGYFVCAAERAQKKLTDYPEDSIFLRLLGSALGSLSRFQDARYFAEQSIHVARANEKYSALSAMALLHHGNGDYKDAANWYEQAFQVDKPFSVHHVIYAECLVKQDEHHQAIKILLESNCDMDIAMDGLGAAYRAIGDYHNALKYFQSAVSKCSDQDGYIEAETAALDLQCYAYAKRTGNTKRITIDVVEEVAGGNRLS